MLALLRGAKDFDADNITVGIIVENGPVGDLPAVFDRAIKQVEMDCLGALVDPHAHGLNLSKCGVAGDCGNAVPNSLRSIRATCFPGAGESGERIMQR